LPIDPDAVLARAVALQGFKLIAWRGTQVAEPCRRVQHIELTQCHALERSPARRTRAVSKEALGCPIGEAPDHRWQYALQNT